MSSPGVAAGSAPPSGSTSGSEGLNKMPGIFSNYRLRRYAGRGLLFLAPIVSLGCRATTIEVLKPWQIFPSDAAIVADSGPVQPECSSGIALNQSCDVSSSCCSGLCALDFTPKLTCRPTPGCVGFGGACSHAGQCCSLACASTDSGTGVCVTDVVCAAIGDACQVATDCCSQICTAGKCANPGPPPPPTPACSAAGEICAAPGECCSGACMSGFDEASRCQLLPGCREQGELCVSAADCCSGECTLEKSGISRCSQLRACSILDVKACNRQVGDTCTKSDDCCSRSCVTTTDSVSRCTPTAGCRQSCDLCSRNADCCSNNCAPDADNVMRCATATACMPEGEVCMRDDQCCQAPTPLRCLEDPKGLKSKRCVVDPATSVCLQDGTSCAVASHCCGGHCLPAPDGGYVCSSACVQEAEPCTSRADCCVDHSDCISIAGRRECRLMIH